MHYACAVLLIDGLGQEYAFTRGLPSPHAIVADRLHAQLSFAVFLLPPSGGHEPATLYCRSRVQALAVAGTEPRLPVHALARFEVCLSVVLCEAELPWCNSVGL